MTAQGDGHRLARDVQRRVWLSLLAANGFAALVLFAMYVVVVPFTFGQAGRFVITELVPAACAYFVLAMAIETRRTIRRFRPVRSWLTEERPPTPDEWSSTVSQPRRQALRVLPHWFLFVGAGLAYALYVKDLPMSASEVFRSVNSVLVAALNGSLLAYLLIERSMRPVLARAHAHDNEFTSTGLGLSARLAIALVSVAGTPMVGVLNTLAWATPEQVEKTGVVAMAAVAGGSGFAVLLMIFIGRALTEPLIRLRRAMNDVGQGDLKVSLSVDESGEIGQLQVGFNEMVDGLRERERMRDLFGRHVGVEVARRAMSGDSVLGGEHRQATTMFVDIIASTHLAQTRTADDVVDILNAFFDAVVRAVGDEEGLINKFAGDGAMCVFGAPADQPDHAARALRAARRLKEKLDGLGSVEAAVGISTGPVVAGNVGAMDRYEYTVIGDPVNEAARLTEQAKANACRLLASAQTVRAAGDEGDNWTLGDTVHLRGRAEPTVTYEPRA